MCRPADLSRAMAPKKARGCQYRIPVRSLPGVYRTADRLDYLSRVFYSAHTFHFFLRSNDFCSASIKVVLASYRLGTPQLSFEHDGCRTLCWPRTIAPVTSLVG